MCILRSVIFVNYLTGPNYNNNRSSPSESWVNLLYPSVDNPCTYISVTIRSSLHFFVLLTLIHLIGEVQVNGVVEVLNIHLSFRMSLIYGFHIHYGIYDQTGFFLFVHNIPFQVSSISCSSNSCTVSEVISSILNQVNLPVVTFFPFRNSLIIHCLFFPTVYLSFCSWRCFLCLIYWTVYFTKLVKQRHFFVTFTGNLWLHLQQKYPQLDLFGREV